MDMKLKILRNKKKNTGFTFKILVLVIYFILFFFGGGGVVL